MGQSEAEFDRALGAWEDNQLNSHLAEEDAWQDASDKAEEAVWDMKLSALRDIAPATLRKKIEEIAEDMVEHVAQLIKETL